MRGTSNRPVSLLLGAVLVACVGCRQAGVARIDGEAIGYDRFEVFLQHSLGETGVGFESDVLAALFDQFLTEELLLKLAADRGATSPGDNRRQAVEKLLAQAQPTPITEDQVRDYYQSHREEFSQPERVQLRQILVEDRHTADQALAELDQGAEFGDVARQLSVDPSASMGGYQGELSYQDLPRTFVDAIFELEAGETSEILEAEHGGYHIFQVVERLPNQVVPMWAADEEIRQILRMEASKGLLESLVQEARQKYNVRVERRNLPFNYTGIYSSP